MKMAFGHVVLLAVLVTGGCTSQSDAVDRELEALKRKFAALEKVHVPRIAEKPVAVKPVVKKPITPPVVRPPAPALNERKRNLKVVKLRPISTDPFASGREPEIRIGKRTVPPVSKTEDRPLRYARLDRDGNLVDESGRIIYRAGTPASKVGITKKNGGYDPHESPARRAARLVKPPRVEKVRNRVPPVPKALGPRGVRRAVNSGRVGGVQPRLRTVPLVRPGEKAVRAPVGKRPPRPIMPRVKRRKVVKRKAGKPKKAPGPSRVIQQRMYQGKKQRAAVALYNKGRKLFVKQEQEKAAKVFKEFLRRFYDHEFADNALYWLGETAYAQHEWLQALSWFQDVVIRYPEGNKLGAAMLKSALCYAKLGDTSYAIKVLTDVETLFPNERIATIARSRRLGLVGGSH